MNKQYLEYLVGFVAAYAQEIGISLSKTQVVKFLYLADLFYAREYKKTLSNWPWRYWHYGPYCTEAVESIEKAHQKSLIFVEEGLEGELFIKGSRFPSEKYERHIPAEVSSPLKYYIKTFAGDLTGLLNYIYSETEPMLEADYGDYLDFSTAQKLPPLKKVHLPRMSKERRKKCRALIERIVSRREQILKNRKPLCLSPEVLKIVEKAYRIWDEEEASSELE